MEYELGTVIGNYKVVDNFVDSEGYKVLVVRCIVCNTPLNIYVRDGEFDPEQKCHFCISKRSDSLVGSIIGKLLVLGRCISNKTKLGNDYYYCKCSCGRIVRKTRDYLISKLPEKSCGCFKIIYPKDLTGIVFGNLTVISNTGRKDSDGKTIWLCRCDCGEYREVTGKALKRGNTYCCKKCLVKSIIGETFGRLTVLEKLPKEKTCGETKYLCKCECGNDHVASHSNLMGGHTRSCGCLSREVTRNRSTKHGLHGTRIYNIWNQIRHRCYFVTDEKFTSYGARGISMCDEWRYDPVAFANWAYANGYTDELTIERIDVNKGYCPENCTWIMPEEQAYNKRNTIRLSNGDSLTKVCKDRNLSIARMRSLLSKGTYTPDEILNILSNSIEE